MIEKISFKREIDKILGAAGYCRKGQSWYLRGPGSIVVVNLQKSPYAEQFYINVGIWLNRFGIVEFPAENSCHIQVRLTALFPEDVMMLEKACSLAEATDDDMRSLADFLQSNAVPFLAECLTEAGVMAHLHAGAFKSGFVHRTVRDLVRGETC